MHDAHAFFVAELRVRLADGHLGVATTHLGLTGESERREGGALGRLVEFRELHLTGVAALLTGVMTLRRCVRLLDRGHEGGTEAFFGGGEVTLELDVRNVEGLAGLVEAERFGVFGQDLLQVEPRSLQEIADRVLIFETVHAALDRAPLRGDARGFLTDEQAGEIAEVGGLLGGVGARLLLGRHLAARGAIEDLDPSLEGFLVGEVGLQGRQVEAAFPGLGVMALDAVLLQERRQRAEGGRRSDEQDEEGEAGKHERQSL